MEATSDGPRAQPVERGVEAGVGGVGERATVLGGVAGAAVQSGFAHVVRGVEMWNSVMSEPVPETVCVSSLTT